MQTITRFELQQRLDSDDNLMIVEALPEAYYRKAHLPGAINIPHTNVDELAPTLLPNKDAVIVVYCSNLACENSTVAADRLGALGYTQVFEYAEGKQDWIAAGLPVESRRDTRRITPASDSTSSIAPVSCSLDEEDLAARSEAIRRDLFAGVTERKQEPDGYSFRFPGEADWRYKIEEFVTTERRCCSFFRIQVTYEPGLGPIWLTLTGPQGVSQFIEETFDVAPVG